VIQWNIINEMKAKDESEVTYVSESPECVGSWTSECIISWVRLVEGPLQAHLQEDHPNELEHDSSHNDEQYYSEGHKTDRTPF